MKILVDREGRKAVRQLCDIALKSAGMQNLNPVNMILRSVTMLPGPEVEEQPRPKSPEEKDVKEESKTPDEKIDKESEVAKEEDKVVEKE